MTSGDANGDVKCTLSYGGASKIFEKGAGAEDNVSATSSFIAIANNELYAFKSASSSSKVEHLM